MDKAWGVTVAPPPQQHKRHDPWHKHELGEKEKAKHIRKYKFIVFKLNHVIEYIT